MTIVWLSGRPLKIDIATRSTEGATDFAAVAASLQNAKK
jgi:hypothetical protein